MKKQIQIRKILYVGILFCLCVSFAKGTYASQMIDGIQSFPESYKGYLSVLQERYPNWHFTALYTNLNWKDVIRQENIFGKNLVPKSYADRWKNTKSGEYNVEVDKGWVDASKQTIEYTMDPRNFLNEVRIFQFESLSYENDANVETIDKILYGTEFYKQKVSYLDANGNQINMAETYADLILRAGKTSLVSSYHLASRIKQEVGPFLSHSSISGIVEGFKGLYNFYNIGATSSSEPMGAIKNGLQYALDGNGANQETKDRLLLPWNTKEKAITGGAIFIGTSYIRKGQNTIYLQKFDVNDARDTTLFWHQYMTNALAPYSESKSIYNGYLQSGVLNSTNLRFIIPVYYDMPELPVQNPNINPDEYLQVQENVWANVNQNLNVRSGPGTNYEILTSIPKNTVLQRIARGRQTGELWDRVILDNGMVGYIFQSYLKIYKKVRDMIVDTNIMNLQIGESYRIHAYIFPDDAQNKNVSFTSLNANIATVDDVGNVKAVTQGATEIVVQTEEGQIQKRISVKVYRPLSELAITFPKEWKIEKGIITGFDVKNLQVSKIKEQIQTDYEMLFYNADGQLLEDNASVGTGGKIVFQSGDTIFYELTILIYGDLNGDGSINSIDILFLQRHILEIQMCQGIYLKAGNISKNDVLPNSIDLLRIVRHVLELQEIEQ